MHLFFVILAIVAVGRLLQALEKTPQKTQVAVNHAPNEPWITQEKEQEIVEWIRSGGLKN